MQSQVLKYRIIIEPEKVRGKTAYNAYCPTLGIADYGGSIDEVLKSIKDGIGLAIEYLTKENKEIPVDNTDEQIVLTTQVKAPSNATIMVV